MAFKYWLMHGDCLKRMQDIDPASVDMICCDLPYGTTACKWDSIIPLERLWAEYARICKGAIILTATQPFTSTLIVSNIKQFKYCWTWDKVKPNGHLVAKLRPMQRTEDVAVFGAGKILYKPQMEVRSQPKKSKEYGRTEIMGGTQSNFETRELTHKYPQSIIVESNASQKNKLHPTQKPVALMEYLIRTYSNEGSIVLDNCFSSGTTGVACANTGRRFIGIEQDAKYFRLGADRIKEAYSKNN